MGRPRPWWVVLALLLCAVVARGQMASGAYANGKRADEHAWVVTPSTTSNDWGLWHIPPRAGADGADDGTVRIIDSLERKPAAMAAAGGRVWLGFAGTGNRAGYGFLTAAVQRGAIDGTWYSGAGGRLAASAFLATHGRLVAMSAGSRGPVALVQESDGTFMLAWLDRGRWLWATGPTIVSDPPPQAVGVLNGGGIVLAASVGGQLHLWTATLPKAETAGGSFELVDPDALLDLASREEAEETPPAELAWSVRSVPLGGLDSQATVVGGPVGIGQRVVLGVSAGSTLWVVEVDGNRTQVIYQAEAGGVALLGASRRGMVVRLAQDAQGAQGRAATRLEIEEFSLDTGRQFYSGAAVFDGPVSPSDIRILLVLMVLVSASLLLFVVRTSKEATPYVAPRGCVLAPPMPRLLAGVADGFLALLLGGELSRLLPDGWLAIRVGAEAMDFGPLVLGLVVGLVAGAVLETLTGRTPGKLIFGVVVSRSGLADGAVVPAKRPGLGASFARNGVKWLLPLVALAGLMSPGLRHRGDSISGLGVVGEAMPVEGGGNSGQDRAQDDR
ncbi:MAG: RDD family protein [Phycisphaerales bacterium JB064]